PSSYTPSLHDALPISGRREDRNLQRRAESCAQLAVAFVGEVVRDAQPPRSELANCSRGVGEIRNMNPGPSAQEVERLLVDPIELDRKSTRLNSSHVKI